MCIFFCTCYFFNKTAITKAYKNLVKINKILRKKTKNAKIFQKTTNIKRFQLLKFQ